MTDTRKAMEMALETLEFMWRDVPMNEYAFEKLEAAIDQLKAALAAQDVRNTKTNWSELVDWWESGAEQWDGLKEIVSSMIAAQGEKREAVAWIDDGGMLFWKDNPVPDGTDLFTHPDPRIKELESEHIERLLRIETKVYALIAVRDALIQDRDEWKEATLMANDNARREEQRRRDMQEERDAALEDVSRLRGIAKDAVSFIRHLKEHCPSWQSWADRVESYLYKEHEPENEPYISIASVAHSKATGPTKYILKESSMTLQEKLRVLNPRGESLEYFNSVCNDAANRIDELESKLNDVRNTTLEEVALLVEGKGIWPTKRGMIKYLEDQIRAMKSSK